MLKLFLFKATLAVSNFVDSAIKSKNILSIPARLFNYDNFLQLLILTDRHELIDSFILILVQWIPVKLNPCIDFNTLLQVFSFLTKFFLNGFPVTDLIAL